ncbi:MAG: glycosyl hydrolase 53 family protein [Lachnospiraceae bacterium]|nr:glycosyl hydrolase 53 family protein [Lachnospiraceae bacterium]
MKNFIKRGTVLVLSAAIIFGGIGHMAKINTHASEVTGAGINVTKVNGINDDFIMGMDVSSYVSVTKSGVVFKDFEGKALDDKGFFNLLKSCGVNYIRIRVWNDPYDANGNGYGGGNCDIQNAAIIGKLATNAGMKVLIDFHYSDFWADPAKQFAPKEWENYTVSQKETAIYDYTKESLTYLKNQGVDIGMVQIGNETTSKFCGESDWNNMCKLFNAGSKAVREIDDNILIALHFTDPQKNRYNSHASYLKNNNVDYDVFASSFYPEWHGTISNLTTQLKNIANNYGKKVMIVETSYPYTLEELDGHSNTINKWNHNNPPIDGYPKVSVQGQADYMVTIIKAMADMGDMALGVCYWEGAWNSVGKVYTDGAWDNEENVYTASDTSWSGSVVNSNKILWEKYGSGWATSYAYEYQPDDVGSWYGGSAVDNQSFFDINGKALASLNVFKYVKTGATTSGGEIVTSDDTTTETTTKKPDVTTTTTSNQETSAEDITTSDMNNESTSETIDETSNETTMEQDETTETTVEQVETDETTVEETKSQETTSEETTSKVEKEKKSGLAIVIIIVTIVVVIVGAATFIVIKKRSKNNENNSDRREDNQ